MGRNAPHVGDGVFVARWSGECAWCLRGIEPGDYVRPGREGLEEDEGWRHESREDVPGQRARVDRAESRLGCSRVGAAQQIREAEQSLGVR